MLERHFDIFSLTEVRDDTLRGPKRLILIVVVVSYWLYSAFMSVFMRITMMHRHKRPGYRHHAKHKHIPLTILKPITYQYSSNKMVYESCKKQEQASKPGFCCPPPPPQNAPLSNPTKNYHEPQNALCCVMSRRVSNAVSGRFYHAASVTRVTVTR